MIRLNELSGPAVALDWHEAVAVAAALTAAVTEARLSHAPTLDAAFLTAAGDLRLTGGGREVGSVTCGLAIGLAALLESAPCPAELRQLVMHSTDPSPRVDTLEEFSRALSFFERPGRVDVLRRLAARAEVALERARATEALERLTERARHAAEPVVPPQTAAAVNVDIGVAARRILGPAAIGTTVFISVALVVATLFTTAQAPDQGATLTVGPIVDDEVPAQREAASPPEAASAVHSVAAMPPSADRSVASGAKSNPVTSPGVASSGEPNVTVRVVELGGAPLPSNASVPAPAFVVPETASTRIYSTADAGVSSPVLVRPHLPAEPPSGVPPWQIGTLELIVGKTGTVEQVHLISPYNRFQERMLMAAAKAWQFQPATKDGRPVRCRTRIRVTL
jgi:hypothetical protein